MLSLMFILQGEGLGFFGMIVVSVFLTMLILIPCSLLASCTEVLSNVCGLASVLTVSSGCLMLFMFFPQPLSLQFSSVTLKISSLYSENKFGDIIQPWCTPILIHPWGVNWLLTLRAPS